MKNQTLAFLCVLGLVAVIVALRPHNEQARADALAGCKTNVRDLSTLMEMYSIDHSGHYPESFQRLMPLYLKELPQCPAAGSTTYSLEVGRDPTKRFSNGFDLYIIRCAGQNHADLPPDQPSYDSETGYREAP